MPRKIHKFVENPGNPINTFVLPFVFTDKVKEAVESIWKVHSPLEHRLILIDNSGEDFPKRKWLEENSHLYIRSYRNLGPALAFNLGIKIATTKYVTIFSDDARLAVPIRDFKYLDTLENTIISLTNIHPQDVAKEDFYHPLLNDYTLGHYDRVIDKFDHPGKGFSLACALGKKETWIKAGLFDETKYIYYIDGSFADQARKNGVECVYSGIVFHFGDASHKGRLVKEHKFHQVAVVQGGVNI